MIDQCLSDSDGKIHVLFVGYFEKVHPFWIVGYKVFPIVSIGSIGDYLIPMENSCIFRGDFEKVAILDEGVGSVSDGIYRIHRTGVYSDGNAIFFS